MDLQSKEQLLEKHGWYCSHPAGYWDHPNYDGQDTLLFQENGDLILFSVRERDFEKTSIVTITSEADLLKLMKQLNIKEMTGAYDLEGCIWHQHSNKLMVQILKLFRKEVPVIDLGCGHNFYISILNYAGYEAVTGIDAIDLGCKWPLFNIGDITKKILLPWSDEFVKSKKINLLSLEVGEHLPPELSSNYLDNVCGFGGDVLMSWAIPGQAGVGHINCRDNHWVIEEMKKRGYKLDFQKTHDLRNAVNGCHCTWLMNTLMYYTPQG